MGMTEKGVRDAAEKELKLWFIDGAFRAIRMNYGVCNPWCWEIDGMNGLHRINFDNLESRS